MIELAEVSEVLTEHKDTKAQRQLHCHGKRVITPKDTKFVPLSALCLSVPGKVFSLVNLRDFESLCSVNRSVLAGDAFVAAAEIELQKLKSHYLKRGKGLF